MDSQGCSHRSRLGKQALARSVKVNIGFIRELQLNISLLETGVDEKEGWPQVGMWGSAASTPQEAKDVSFMQPTH